MGADAFHVFYGIRIKVPADAEDALDAVETGTDPRCRAARQAGLRAITTRITDGADYSLLIGLPFATFGVEGEHERRASLDDLSALAARVQAKLVQAGFSEEAGFHFRLHAQY